ncbi:ORF 3 [Fusarium graminearum dsRNA mycovirus 1]|uniref:ORF 3 n=1 Tax=Fusarium graminearum dsRNA mycovirus 1 TaxID=194397 RepID=Q5GHF4_9VIRU|nr:ORF 3 [Fusarium graminearum dsRNA mycovirus-1]AAT07069.1 ORF 3 [Fusarium graminearum dsRNA mycovirus-1]
MKILLIQTRPEDLACESPRASLTHDERNQQQPRTGPTICSFRTHRRIFPKEGN